ncbi:MAG: signal peptidase I, partial [Chloroflexi bacterium]|nr:signal peptidase I [Chloroflexota bacterium]
MSIRAASPATELSGSLACIGFVPLVQFLAGLGKTGSLRVWREAWVADVGLERGELIGATADEERGLAALDFILLALSEGDFAFTSGQPELDRNLDERSQDVHAHLERLASSQPSAAAARIGPTAVPQLIELASDDPDGEVRLSRRSLQILLEVDGNRTVEDIGRRRGRSRSVKELIHLVDLGLVTLAERPPTTGPQPRSSPPGGQRPAPPTAEANANASRRPTSDRSAAERPAAQQPRPWWHRSSLPIRGVGGEILQGVALTAALVIGARVLVQNFRVDGASMDPTFSSGQALVVDKVAYYHVEDTPLARFLPATRQGSILYPFGGPQRGDVAVFHAPTEPGADFIKRIIGLPGDRVLIRNGQVLVNDQPVDDSEILFRAAYTYPSNGEPLVVPDDSYFVLGDNRPVSYDSHTGWVVPASDLVGQAWVRYWPPAAVSLL